MVRALKNDNSRVSTTRCRCHPAFPHAVITIFVRGRIDVRDRLCLPQRFLQFASKLSSYFRPNRGSVRRLEHPEVSSALLVDETSDCSGNRMVCMFVTNKHQLRHSTPCPDVGIPR